MKEKTAFEKFKELAKAISPGMVVTDCHAG